LVVAHGVDTFNGEGLANDLGGIDGGVVHPGFDFLAQELLAFLPEDRILIHGEAGVLGNEDQGVADGLHIPTIGANAVVGTKLAPDGIGGGGGDGRRGRGVGRSTTDHRTEVTGEGIDGEGKGVGGKGGNGGEGIDGEGEGVGREGGDGRERGDRGDWGGKGVGLQIVGEELEGVGVDVEGITLGVVDTDGTIGGLCITEGVAVETVVAMKLVAIVAVDENDVAVGFGEGAVRLIIERVAFDAHAFVTDDGTIQEIDLFATGIVVTILAIDVVVAIVDIGGTDDACKARAGVVVQGVGDEGTLGGAEVYIIIEDSLPRGGAVLSPLALQRVLAVHQPSAIEEIAQVIQAVIVKGVAVEQALAMGEDNVITGTGQLVGSVVEEDVRDKGQGVALVHVDMAVGVEGVGLLVVEGAVAREDNIVVAEAHVAHQDLCIAVYTLVVEEFIGMEQNNHRPFFTRCSTLLPFQQQERSSRPCHRADGDDEKK